MIPIVLSTQRTGSTFLFLHFHPKIQHVCYEPYNSEIQRDEYKAIASAPEFKNRIVDVIGYLEYLSQFGVIDLKLEITPMFVIKQIYKNNKKFNSTILYRDNILHQYISKLTAGRSVVFYDSKEQREKPLTVDISAFNPYCKTIADYYAEAAKNIPGALITSYEDMNVGNIAKHLGIPVKFSPDIVKLHNDYSFVTNREELNANYPEWKI